LLRLAPALIWESGERPALFAGTVAIDTTPAEINGSAPGTPPAVVGQPAPEGQETPPWECPRSDTALPTAAPPVPDVMEDMLPMVGLDGTADMGKSEEPVEKV
ncbi:relaxase, partial [Pseudomonas aeruginosa]|nr:relaxase [Pseudomonas aeruginosa]